MNPGKGSPGNRLTEIIRSLAQQPERTEISGQTKFRGAELNLFGAKLDNTRSDSGVNTPGSARLFRRAWDKPSL